MSRSFVPPALAALFSGTALASTAPAPGASADDDGGNSPELSNADAQRIAANAATAVTQATAAERQRWTDVLGATTGEGNDAQAIADQPLRLAAALEFLGSTDLPAASIVASVSKPAFAMIQGTVLSTVASESENGVDQIAAATARERMRTTPQPQTGTGASAGAGGDGTGAGGRPKGRPDSVKAQAQERNKSAAARGGVQVNA